MFRYKKLSHGVSLAGLSVEGIYRLSAPITRLDSLERALEASQPLHFNDAHEAAGLLKVRECARVRERSLGLTCSLVQLKRESFQRYLRALPRPLLPPAIIQYTNDCRCEWNRGCDCGAARRVT